MVLGVPLQKFIKGPQAIRNALGIIQAVDRQNQLALRIHQKILFQLTMHLRTVLQRRLVNTTGRLGKLIVINAHRKGIRQKNPVVDMNLIEIDLITKKTAHTAQKVSLVIVGMEAYQIGTQQALQQLLTPGQNAKDLIRRKRDVQKVADGDRKSVV